MRRIYMTMAAAGMAGFMLILGGCSGQAAGGTSAAEIVTESETDTESKTESETDTETESETEAGMESETETASGTESGTENRNPAESEASAGAGTSEALNGAAASEDGTAKPLSGVGESGIDVSVPVHIWGTIASAGEEGIMVDNQSDNSSKGEMLLTIDPAHTVIAGAVDGLPVELKDIQLGSFEAYLGPAMTMSLPPQVTPYVVIVNIPEGSRSPQYAVATDRIQTTDSGKILTANDGTEYVLAENAEIIPYLTRNIVALEDIREGSRMLLWLNEEDKVVRIVLFAE